MSGTRASPRERLMRRVWMCPMSGCWFFMGSLNATGYGRIKVARASYWLAHRLAWREFRGELPADADVLHACDVPSCVNPAHLSLGTHADNMADMVAKGRSRNRPVCGEAHPRAKLTADDVRTIRSDYAAGIAAREIAARYGIVPAHVSYLARRQCWRHV